MAIFGLPQRGDMTSSNLEPEDQIQAGQSRTDLPAQPMCPVEAPMAESLNAGTAGTNGTYIEDDGVVPLSARRSGRPSSRPEPAPTGSHSAYIRSQHKIKYNLLARRLMESDNANARDFYCVHDTLRQQLQPVGVLEEMLVERMAYEYFRKAASAKHYCDVARYVVNTPGSGPANLLKYDSMITRQFDKAMHELERLQRFRGEN